MLESNRVRLEDELIACCLESIHTILLGSIGNIEDKYTLSKAVWPISTDTVAVAEFIANDPKEILIVTFNTYHIVYTLKTQSTIESTDYIGPILYNYK